MNFLIVSRRWIAVALGMAAAVVAIVLVTGAASHKPARSLDHLTGRQSTCPETITPQTTGWTCYQPVGSVAP